MKSHSWLVLRSPSLSVAHKLSVSSNFYCPFYMFSIMNHSECGCVTNHPKSHPHFKESLAQILILLSRRGRDRICVMFWRIVVWQKTNCVLGDVNVYKWMVSHTEPLNNFDCLSLKLVLSRFDVKQKLAKHPHKFCKRST